MLSENVKDFLKNENFSHYSFSLSISSSKNVVYFIMMNSDNITSNVWE